MLKKTFLVEIGTEELPPKTLRSLAENFYLHVVEEFKSKKIYYEKIKWFASPRRFALKINNINEIYNEKYIEKKGPSIVDAFDTHGNPTEITKKWIYNLGIKIEEINFLETAQGKWLVYYKKLNIESIKKFLYDTVVHSINRLSISKKMRWGKCNSYFIRPVHTITMLLDSDIINGKIFGIRSNRIILGHRFMSKKKIILHHANHYPEILIKNKVIANYLDRKKIIYKEVKRNAKKLDGVVDLDDSFLEEVNSLVEWPVVLTTTLKKNFFKLPIEILLHIIKHDAKHFPVYDKSKNKKLIPYTIFVSNIESIDSRKIILGNERVIDAKLQDAVFFFNKDRKYKLEEFLPLLDKTVFQDDLGTLKDKTNRIRILSAWIADNIGADKVYTDRAGLLSKCDLVSEVVCKFTFMQGIIGMHYARLDGEPEIVALAQKEQYQPKDNKDDLPSTLVSCALSIADKMDNIVGIIGINKNPNSSKDPFVLRRNATGIIRILIERSLPINLKKLVMKSICLYQGKLKNKNVLNEIMDFMFLRIFSWYRKQKYNLKIIRSILVLRPNNLLDFNARLVALNNIFKFKTFENLVLIFKRVSNILLKNNYNNGLELNTLILNHPLEIKLVKKIVDLNKKIQFLVDLYCYKDALIELLDLNDLINDFFKNVLIMTNDIAVRKNRLSILLEIRKLFLKIADLSVL